MATRCWHKISENEVPEINFHIPPANHGQIVTVSYGIDWEENVVYCHWYDASDKEEHWYYRDWMESIDGEADFWNGAPTPVRVCGSERRL